MKLFIFLVVIQSAASFGVSLFDRPEKFGGAVRNARAGGGLPEGQSFYLKLHHQERMIQALSSYKRRVIFCYSQKKRACRRGLVLMIGDVTA